MSQAPVKLISWNINQRLEPWHILLESGADIALLQEASQPPAAATAGVDVSPGPWRTAGTARRPWRTAVVKLSSRVTLEWFNPMSIDEASHGDLAVSRLGTLAAAQVTPAWGEPFVVASLYGLWESPHRHTASDWIYSDASVHRLISDLSALIRRSSGHRIVAAGDLNILYGYGEHGSRYWKERYATVFERMSALGLKFIGPQSPAGRQAEPWPQELPSTSKNVPTYRTNRQTPGTATRQLDFVFASYDFCDQVRVKALNDVEVWGPSDHCRLEIEISDPSRDQTL
jgi:endonuclease/exonuclease/phosphatase family metal-dependent hydrolase